MLSNTYLENLWEERLKDWAWQVKDEYLQLLKLLNTSHIQNIIEIGCWDGGTAAGFCSIGCSVLSIDIEKRDRVKEVEKLFPEYFLYLDRSELYKADPKIWLTENYHDMLFIDGAHDYESVKRDYEEFLPYVIENGIVVFHDIIDTHRHPKSDCDVYRFWNEIKGDRYQEIITDKAWGGIGVKFL